MNNKGQFTPLAVAILIGIGIVFGYLFVHRPQVATNYPARPTTAPSRRSVHFPEPTGYVVDEAGKLSDATKNELERKATDLGLHGGPQVAVVIVREMGGEDVEQYTMHLAEKWKVGDRASDNGVILLVAMAERKIRIEVGTGLEPKLPDSKVKEIIDRSISPFLKTGDFDGGMKAGFNEITKEIL